MSGPLPLPKNYVPLVVTLSDIKLATLAWGFTLGVGALTCVVLEILLLMVLRANGA